VSATPQPTLYERIGEEAPIRQALARMTEDMVNR